MGTPSQSVVSARSASGVTRTLPRTKSIYGKHGRTARRRTTSRIREAGGSRFELIGRFLQVNYLPHSIDVSRTRWGQSFIHSVAVNRRAGDGTVPDKKSSAQKRESTGC